MNLPAWMRRLVALVNPTLPRYSGPLAARSGGMLVNTDSSLSCWPVWGCVNAITGAIAPLEWDEMRIQADGTKNEVSTNINWLLNRQANPELSAFSWRELALTQALLAGNHYSEIERDAVGRPLWLWPLRPEAVQPWRDDAGNLIYRYWQPEGGQIVLPAKNVYHLHGMGWDGVTGYSVITLARRSIGTGLAMDEYGANFYANGTHLGLVYKHPQKLSEDAQNRLRKSMREKQGGPGNAFREFFLEEGMTVDKVTMTMVDAQFTESGKKIATDICGWFRVPPHKIGLLDRATFSNIEHQAIEFVQDALTPWCRRLEQEADIKLYGRGAQLNTYTRIDTDPLLRGDLLTRATAYEKFRNAGVLSANDCREMDERNPIPDGDIYLQPLNYVEAGTQPEPAADAGGAADTGNGGEPAPAANVIRRGALDWARKQKEQTNG